MTFLRMIRSELTRLTSSGVAIITVIGLALIPLLYAGIYLYGNWEPEDNLEGIDAVLVNSDEPADFDGERRSIGQEVTEELLDEATFSWHTEDTMGAAVERVETGEYLFALVIPQDFSAALASPGSFDYASQARLEVITNDANNYLVGDMAHTLAAEVHDSVSAQVSEETADAMLTGFGRIHQQLLDASQGAGELAEGSDELTSGLQELRGGADTLGAGLGEARAGAQDLTTGAGELAEGADALHAGASELSAGAGELTSGLRELGEGAAALETATADLADGAATLETNLAELSAGAQTVAEGNAAISAAADDAADLLHTLSNQASTQVDSSVDALVEAGIIENDDAEAARAALADTAADTATLQRADAVRNDLASAQSDLDALATGSQDVASGASELAGGASTLRSGATELRDSVPALTSGLSEAQSGAEDLSSGADQLAGGAGDLSAGAHTLHTGLGSLLEGLISAETGTGDLQDGLADAHAGAGELGDGAAELTSRLSDGSDEVPNPDSSTQAELSSVMGQPLTITETTHNEAGSYGAGMAPFFMALSLWIGALVMLQVLRPISTRALASNGRIPAIAAGAWFPFLLLSGVQCLLLYAITVLGVGLEPTHPWVTLGLMLMSSMAFTALIFGAVLLLGNPGKMVALILLVIQLVAAGGTFPAALLPPALESVHHLLPMTYAIDGLRHAIYGGTGDPVLQAVLVLGATTAVGFALQVLAVRKRRMWTVRTLQPPIAEAA